MGKRTWPESSGSATTDTSHHYTDPGFLQAWQVGNTSLYNDMSGSAASASGFWSNVDDSGTSLNSNWTADVYKTLVDISSQRGLLAHIYGPVPPANPTVTTFRVTVDGTAYTFAFSTTSTSERVCLISAARFLPSMTTSRSGDTNYHAPVTEYNSNELTRYGVNLKTPLWGTADADTIPMLYFSDSLKVEMKLDGNQSTDTSMERRSGVIHLRLPDAE